ncbi:hypothetical protein HD806DRAFT_522547 [Xylariaceae sp. AK1471]|nr:hypothetical protein HD806DRAFT_522547 [Xylariaceae sp. AK1471]
MPRTLPWKRREQEASQLHKSARSTPVQRIKRGGAGSALDEADSTPTSDAEKVAKKTLKRPRRSASTSPPTEPPQENFMIEGLNGDDRYRMVEDEFLATAQQFTAHLHAAEYKRLKADSELGNAQTIKNISRPVIGQMTNLVKIKRERKALGEKQRLATRIARKRDASDNESTGTDDLNDSWQKQSLYGLMESPGKRTTRLDGLLTANSVTRAAAGYNRQATDVVSPSQPKPRVPSSAADCHAHESEDDLDAPNNHRIKHQVLQPGLGSSIMTAPKAVEARKPSLSSSYKTVEIPQAHQPKTAEILVPSDGEEIDFIARFKKRQAERKRSRERRKSTNSKVKLDSSDILPDFL